MYYINMEAHITGSSHISLNIILIIMYFIYMFTNGIVKQGPKALADCQRRPWHKQAQQLLISHLFNKHEALTGALSCSGIFILCNFAFLSCLMLFRWFYFLFCSLNEDLTQSSILNFFYSILYFLINLIYLHDWIKHQFKDDSQIYLSWSFFSTLVLDLKLPAVFSNQKNRSSMGRLLGFTAQLKITY